MNNFIKFLFSFLFLVFFVHPTLASDLLIDFEDKTVGDVVDDSSNWFTRVYTPPQQLEGRISSEQSIDTKSLKVTSVDSGGSNTAIVYNNFTASTTFDFWVYAPSGQVPPVFYIQTSDCNEDDVGLTYTYSKTFQFYSTGNILDTHNNYTGRYISTTTWSHVYISQTSTGKFMVKTDVSPTWYTDPVAFRSSCVGEMTGIKMLGVIDYYYLDNLQLYSATSTYTYVTITEQDGLGMSIFSPTTDNYPNYQFDSLVGTTTIPYVLSYTLPEDKNPTDYYFAVEYSYYSDFSSSTLQTYERLDIADSNNDERVNVGVTVPPTSYLRPIYYKFYLINNSNIVYTLSISVNDYDHLLPIANQDLGFWGNIFRSVFVPKVSTMKSFMDLKDTAGSKVPFGYVNLISDSFSSSTYSGVDYATASSSFSGTGMDTVFTPIRTVLTFALWFIFAGFLIWRIRHLEIL